jgi:putative ABC transport system substrate-binding protein
MRLIGLAIILAFSVNLAPIAAEAQQAPRVARVGLLSSFSRAETAAWHHAFGQGLRDFGWIEGTNVTIEYRFAEGRIERLSDLAADLVRLKVDVIVTSVTPDALAAKKATQAIPIVMAAAGDVLVTGLVESLARPGGNITGLSQMNPELVGKRLELPKEIVPSLTRVAVLWNPADMISALTWRQIQLPARSLSIELHSMEVRTSSDIDKAFEGATRARSGAVAIMPSPVFVTNLKRLADLTAKNRLPSIFHVPDFVSAGGLVTYGPDGLLAKPDRPPVLDSRRATPIPIKGVLSASELMGGVLHRQEPVARRAGGREDHQDRGRLGG